MIENHYALTTLSQHPEYFEEVIALIEEEFKYSEKFHYEKDFAPLMDTNNFENCFLYIDSRTNKVAAHLAVCLRTAVKKESTMPVALIGGIATAKEHRGKSLFKSLMKEAISRFENEVGLFILWSDLENLYEKFNFYRTGGFFESGSKNFTGNERPPGYEKTKFNELNVEDLERITSLYKSFNENHFFTLTREEREWSIIREMNSIDLYIKKNSKGSIDRYFCVNKGRDLTNIIHEVSCTDTSDFLKMLKEIEQYKTWLPESELNNKNAEIFYTAFIKIGSLKILNRFIEKISHRQLVIISDQVTFTFQGKQFEASQKDFLQYVFGPKPLDEFKSFGLSLYISGADSV